MKHALTFSRMPKLFRRMFWRIYLLFAGITTILCIGALFWILKETISGRHVAVQRMARELASIAESWLESCQNMSIAVGQIPEFQELSDNEAHDLGSALLDPTLLGAAQHALVTARARDLHIERMAVYLYNREYVVTDQGTVVLDRFYQTLFATNAVPQSEYLRRLGPGKFLFLRQNSIDASTPECPVYITSVIDRDGKRYGNLFVFLDTRELKREIDAVLDEKAYFAIFDKDGDLVYGNDSLYLTKAEMLAETARTGDAPLLYHVGTYSGWEICMAQPKNLLAHRLLYRSLMLGTLWLILLILGAPAALFLCRKNYAPLQELARVISPQNVAGTQEMEYEAMQAVIASIFADRQMLKEQILIYKPLLISSLLLELLDGSQQKNVTRNALHALGIDLSLECWCCVAINTEEARHDALVALAERTRIPGRVMCLAATHSRSVCVFLLNAESRGTCMQATQKLQQYLDVEESVLSWGASEIVTDIEHLTRAYQHARTVLDYAVLDTATNGTDWTTLSASGVMELRQPDILKNLFSTFSVGRISEARRMLLEYFSCIIYDGYAQKEHLRFLQKTTLSALLKLRQEYGIDCSTEPLRQWNGNERDSIRHLHDLCMSTCDELDGIMSAWLSEQLVQRENSIMEYLNVHIFDEDLSLSKLAVEFGISESVISRKVKTLSSENFLDYVNHKRIEHACVLLQQTDISINDLAANVGYGNDITFRRSFKKYMGVTPSEYRREHAPERE